MKLMVTVLLLLNLNVFSQEGKATYGIKYSNYIKQNSFGKSFDNQILAIYKELNKANDNVEFILLFNKKESSFYLNKSLNIDDKKSDITVIVSGGNGKFYNSNKKRIRQVNSYGNLFLIDYDLITESDWVLEKDKKIINGYECFKAKTKISFDSHEHSIVEAWYCPKIPTNFGPLGIGNLPGLILELTITNRTQVTYYLTKLNLNIKKNKIIKPKKGKKVTKKEFDAIGKKLMDQIKSEKS